MRFLLACSFPNLFLSAFNCCLVVDTGLTHSVWVPHNGSAWEFLEPCTFDLVETGHHQISWGVEDTPLSKDSASMSFDSLEFNSSEGNLWYWRKYDNARSKWTSAAIHQMYCGENRQWRCSKVANNFAKVHNAMSASFSTVLLLRGVVLPL